MAELSAYELERNRTIAENEAKLVELGLESASAAIREHTAAKREAATHEKKERLKRMPPPEPTRASKRVRSEKPQYTGEKIDKFGDEIDAKIEKQARVGASGEEKAAARAAAMEAARLLLEEARAKLQAERGGSKRGSKKGGDAGWRAEAIKRWGARAGECATDDWEGYVASREAKPAPTSPELLLQEVYIVRPDVSPAVGWETGRDSEPAFLDMNRHALREEKSEPPVVLYQFDQRDPMNPLGLLMAYAEDCVKPVVSDFDTFLVGSKACIHLRMAYAYA